MAQIYRLGKWRPSDADTVSTSNAPNDSKRGGGGGSGDSSNGSLNKQKFRAKRFNEQLKAGYGFLNTLAGAVLLTAWISPTIKQEPLPYGLDNPVLVIGGLALHAMGQLLLRFFMRPEE